MCPEIHDLAHKILLAGGVKKQDMHCTDRLKFIKLVNRFTEMYSATKDIKTVRKPSPSMSRST